ncbi:MAG TPA: PD-(D/E)XK nuclease family protein [Nitrospiraceae bacterium]|nr:PD-(D/E)XK nuclease family protein [Nitrospiraceae bacterium]
MLRLVTDPFQPRLESSLVSDLRRLKSHEPLAPLAIIVPSDTLRDRVKRLLCIEQGLTLVNVHVLTFYQLALRLLSEREPFDTSRLQSSVYFHELVHHLLRRLGPDSPWHPLAETPGAWSALFATLRDLKDAGVDADRVADVWSQRWPGGRPEPQPLWLLYRQFLEMRRQLSAWDADDLAVLATEKAGDSDFLTGLRHALYYGFYDLTQGQLDFFRAVTGIVPATLYFPLIDGHPDFGFAQRFFDAHIRGLGRLELQSTAGKVPIGQLSLFDEAPPSPVESQSSGAADGGEIFVLPRVMSAGSPLDEVTTVAKDILSLVEERGYRFADIGVVVRSLSAYADLIGRVFAEQGIPVATDLGRSLAAWPFVKAILQLVTVRASDYHREDVLELLSSPFLRREAICPDADAARPDLWSLAVRRLGVTKGKDQWQRLTRFLDQDFPLHDGDDDGTGRVVPVSQIRLFWDTFTGLADALDALPESAPWSQYVDSLHELIGRLLLDDSVDPQTGVATPGATLSELLAQLRRLDEFSGPVPLTEFVLAVHRAVDSARHYASAQLGCGLQVLDAMAARGLSFRALYVLGLNEKCFPRFIHEDAFLRDTVRHMLEQDIGYKIQTKVSGYEEERLLFTLLCRSAREQLTLSYLRADETGRPLVPSGYVDDLCQGRSLTPLAVPRRPAERYEAMSQYRPDCLTESELTTRFLLDRRIPTKLFTQYPGGLLLQRSLVVLQAHDRMEHRLGPYDGLIGAESGAWEKFLARGLSPSTLRRYASCPFQFFAASVLRIETEESAMPGDPIGPLEQGILAHRILRRWMEDLAGQGFFARGGTSSVDPFTLLEDCARQVFADYEMTHPVGYALTWELHQRGLLTFLHEVGRQDLAHLAGEWQPVLFEYPVSGELSVDLGNGSTAVPVKGRLDRVDWSPERRIFRVVDYKFKRTKEPKSHEKNLALGAIRGHNLQPPLYLLMAEGSLASVLGADPSTCDGVWFYYLAPDWEERMTRVLFPGDAWRSSLRAALSGTFRRIFTGIRSGHFFIAPHESLCERCDFTTICRRSHQASAWRARTDDAPVQSHRELRRARPPAGGDAPDVARESCTKQARKGRT